MDNVKSNARLFLAAYDFKRAYYVVTESGAPMDFINAERHMEDEHLKYLENPEGYWKFHNTSEAVSSNGCPDNNLPF